MPSAISVRNGQFCKICEKFIFDFPTCLSGSHQLASIPDKGKSGDSDMWANVYGMSAARRRRRRKAVRAATWIACIFAGLMIAELIVTWIVR